MRKLKTVAIIVFSLLGLGAPVFAHDATRPCSDPEILGSITQRFLHQSHIVNKRHLGITDFSNVHEHRSFEKGEFNPIARRYCGATATLSDGKNRTVWYLIESSAGISGLGNGVEFCVSGFDRWNAYDASCRVLR